MGLNCFSLLRSDPDLSLSSLMVSLGQKLAMVETFLSCPLRPLFKSIRLLALLFLGIAFGELINNKDGSGDLQFMLIFRKNSFCTCAFSSGLGAVLFSPPSHSRSARPPFFAISALTRRAKSAALSPSYKKDN